MPDTKLKLLFVCSRNQWRSPTAEKTYQKDPRVVARSRGTARGAVRTLTVGDLQWADLILVMEQKHQRHIVSHFGQWAQHKPIHVLDIPDDYQFMDADLVEAIQCAVEPLIAPK
ncbi:MAG TPA: phosphotyrosine protein phosphatase [Planctomycetaceae bacterium]|nr:phosphotyrosine protein phosphatase [Planctomycetaceae bacterium]